MATCPLIEVEELKAIYKNPEVLLFDVSHSKQASTNYANEHLDGAFFIDLNEQLAAIKSDPAHGGRHPLPSIQQFLATLSEVGITNKHHVVLYDEFNGSNAAARFWWMLKAIGYEKVQVLNGGFQQAKKSHFPINSTVVAINKVSDSYSFNNTNWMLPTYSMSQVAARAQHPNYLVVDVRAKERYAGITEPIDLIAGHIPGALNIPFTENLEPNGLFRSPSALRATYASYFGNTKPANIVIHCGSGVTACHTLLALAYAGFEIPNLYVGSWSEWSRNNQPIGTTAR